MRYFFCGHPTRFLAYLYKLAGVEHYRCERCHAIVTKKGSRYV